MDVGCGTGELTIPLSSKFEEVVAIDSSDEMIEEAKRRLLSAGITNIRFVTMSGDQISPELGLFRVIVFGSSLHWMAIEDVLQICWSVLVPNGGIVIADMRSIWGGTSEWEQAVVQTIQRWVGIARRAGEGTFREPVRRYEDMLVDLGFSNVESGYIPCKFELDIPFIIGHLYSTSYCNRHLLGGKAPDFENNLRQVLLALNPSGVFQWQVDVNYLFADRR